MYFNWLGRAGCKILFLKIWVNTPPVLKHDDVCKDVFQKGKWSILTNNILYPALKIILRLNISLSKIKVRKTEK